MADLTDDIRETVRQRYANAAKAAATGADDQARALESESGCCGPDSLTRSPADETGVFGASLYDEPSRESVPTAAVDASLGCGVPTAVAELRDGDTVLDLGSGAGADVLISARRVAPTGRAIGLDMSDEMLDLARANAAEAGVANVEFVKGYLEDMRPADPSRARTRLGRDRASPQASRVLRPRSSGGTPVSVPCRHGSRQAHTRISTARPRRRPQPDADRPSPTPANCRPNRGRPQGWSLLHAGAWSRAGWWRRRGGCAAAAEAGLEVGEVEVAL
jgi:arsenite methyltransferase